MQIVVCCRRIVQRFREFYAVVKEFHGFNFAFMRREVGSVLLSFIICVECKDLLERNHWWGRLLTEFHNKPRSSREKLHRPALQEIRSPAEVIESNGARKVDITIKSKELENSWSAQRLVQVNEIDLGLLHRLPLLLTLMRQAIAMDVILQT